MPITVRGPDGAILNFPDGTSQEEMRAAMISRYGPPGENQRGADYRARFNPTPQEVEQQRQDVQAQADSNLVTQGIGAAYGALNRFRNVLPNSVRVLADTVAATEAVRVRARNGDAERDFQQNDGFLDRSGSLLERSVASAVGGLDRATGTVLPGRLGRTFQARARDMESSGNRAVAGETTWDDVKADPFTNILPYIYETAVGSSVEMGITAMPGGLAAESTIQAGRIGQQRAQNDGRRDATLADVGIGALFGIPSTYLERLGITSIFSGAAKTAAGRIASATAVEAGTEAAQSSLEYTGGTIGTAQGWDATEMLDQAAAGAVGGGGMGGAIRTTVEAADAVGNRMRRPRAPISAQDQASPLPDDLIAEGRAATGLAADGPAMPQPGGRVVVTAPTGEQRAGVFQGITRGDDGSALVTIQMDDGRTISQPADILADAGFQVRPEQGGGPIDYAAGADAVDAQLADAAQQALQQAQQGAAATPSTSVLPAPAAPAPAAGTAPVTGDGREQFKARVRRSESGGNDRARNPNGSASGRYQFIESTFKTLYQRVYGGTEADAAAAWNSDRRYAPEVQERLMDAAINEYEQVYSRAGITPTAGNLYLAHFFGPQMAARVLQAPRGADIGSIVGEAAVAANERVLRGKTVADVIAWTDRAMGGAGAVDGGGTAQPGYQAQPGTQFTDMPDLAAPARLTREPVNFITEDRADTAVTTTGREVPVRYAVAELSDLVASNDIDGNPNPDFPAARQPRDRSRAASRAQIQEIATKLNPRLLGRSPKASDGAPIVSIDGVVESGNGRTIALQAAYAAGGERIDAYRQMIEAEGFDTSGMQQPVLVRVRDPNMSEGDVQSFIREANQRDTAAMSGTESAEADAAAMPASLLDLYRGGDIDAASNRDFVRGFMQAVIPSSEHGQMVMPDGAIAKPLLSRIEAALLVRAFGRQPFIGKLVDATDNDIRAIGKALIETAGAVAQLRQAAAEGRIDPAMDISGNIAEAVEIVDRARREKKPITDYVNQRDIFSGETVDPMTEAVLRLFFARPDFTKPVGQARLAERIGFYLAEAEKSVPGGGLLGPSTATGPGDILALANERDARPDGSQQPDLLRAPQGVPDAGNGGDVRPDRRDDQRPAGEGVQPQAGEGSGGQGVAPLSVAELADAISDANDPRHAQATEFLKGNRDAQKAVQAELSTRLKGAVAGMMTRQARVEDTGTGKSVAIIGASEAELAAVASVIPNAKPLKRKDGATVYSKKYEDKIRAALVDKSAGNSRPVAEPPAQPNAKNEQETQPTETPVRRVVVNTVGADGLTEAERNAMAAKRGWPPFGPMVRDVVGEDIDKDWTAFSTKSNTLGIPRADMPQIKSAHRGALINFLNARGIEHEEFESQPSALWPTQAEFSPAKVKQAIDYDFGDRAILISKEGYVVDGHHQWLAALWQQTGRGDREHDVRTIQLKAPIRELLAAIAEFPSVQKSKGATGGGSVDLVYVSKAGTQVKNLVPGRDDRRGEIEVQTDALLPRAERNQKVLDQFGADIPGWQSPGVKSRDRIVEKVLTEGYASPLALKDVVRGAAVVDTMADADRIAAQVASRFKVVEDKGWQTLSSGYVDRKIIVDIDGVKAEVQIVPRVVWDAKKNGANALYRQYRVAGTEAAKDRLQSEMQAVYAAALAGSDFASVSSAAKSTSLNAAPASRGESGTPSLSASAGAETQSASDRPSPSQTNAEGGTRENTATSRPSTSNSDGAGIASTSEPQVGANREESNKGPSPNRLVTDERAAELRARLKAKLNPNRLNAGIDPEIIAIGSELAVYHIEKGARRFTAFARAIAADLGMGVKDLRQYLRGWYNGSRDMLEDMGESVAGMDTPDEVARAMRTLDQWADEAPADQVTPPADSATGATDGLQGSLFDGDAAAGARDVPVSAQDRGAGSAPQPQDAGSVQPPRSPDGERAQAPERGGARPAGAGDGRADSARATDRVPGGTEPSVAPTNWRIEPGSLAEARKPMEKAEDNVRAIEIVKRLQEEGRAATPEEQAKIALYVGWGGLANVFPRPDGTFANAGMQRVGLRLKELLTKEEYDTARRSTQYAHYTSEKVVRPMWELARRLGFKGGTVFEPGMGTGNFAGMMPPDLAAATNYQGLEYDRLTAQIAKALYPAWGVRQDDYTKTPRIVDQFDLAIGNPPFSRTVISGDPYYGKMGFLLHDFFFAKTLDALRPGGLLLFVTSAGTMNKIETKARDYLADRADLVGAVRLPSTAFAENAGTEVTTDIIVLRKRPVGAAAGDRSWTETVQMTMPDREGNMTMAAVNRYFADNPAMILGEQGMFDKLVAGPRYAVRAKPGVDLEQALLEALDNMAMRHTLADHANTAAPAPAIETAPAPAAVDFMVTEQKEGSFYVKDGDLYRLEGGVGRKVQSPGKGVTGGVSKDAQAKIRRLVGIRDALRATLAGDLSGDAAASEKARTDLNRIYDDFVAAFGPINKTDIRYQRPSIIQQESARAKAREEARANGLPWDEGSFDATPLYDSAASTGEIARARQQAREAAKAAGRPFDEGSFNPEDMDDVPIIKRPNIDPFMSDQEGYRLRSIEHFNEDTGVAKKGLVFFENPVAREAKPAIASPEDALLYVMAMQGWPDIAEIARLAGTSEADTLAALKGYLFKVPGTDRYETRETYLSGNVRDKLDVARRALEGDETLAHNVEALEAVQPEPLSRVEITVQLGMPWVPTAVIEKFGTEALGLSDLRVSYNAKLARYSVSGDDRSAAATTDWGTQKREAPYLVADALNRNSPKIYVKRSDGSSELDSAATQEAQDKIFAIKARFREWVWEDEQRALELESLYNREYNNLVAPVFDGSYLKTPGINAKWRWRPHQSAVVARIIQTGNTYMAHGVGAGKTSAMIGAGMEMKRLGLVKKPMYAVPNHMLGQFTKEFYEQYPTARIMVADETRFHTSRRKQFVADVANSDIDAVIMTHSSFGLLPVSAEFENSLLDEQIADLRSALEEIDGDQSNRITIKQLEQQIEQLEQRQEALRNRKKDAVYTFEETGIDFLFVDEAHLFRKLGFATKMGQVKGIDPNGAQSSFDLFAKIQLLESRTPGRSVVLASGTPITNTMAELYTVQRYMQRGMLRAKGLDRFDAWAGSFGDTDTKLEQDPAGGYKPVTRFAKFVNVPELSVMVRQFMDVVTSQELEALVVRPKLKGGKRNMVVVEQTDRQRNYQDSLRERMVAIQARKGPPAPGDDILLSVINDGRKAAIDMRLIDRDNPKEDSKLERLVANVYRIWQESKRQPFHAIEADGYSAKPVDFGPATQMVFADLGVNETEGKDGSRGISVHEYIRAQLIQRGVPQREIALISNFKNAVQRQRLFNDMNDGRVRILIGSVPKMGTGVNAQQRLLANHNLDAQWYPANDEQRNGRIIRQGNMNPEVEIYDYSTKGTYDSTMWGLMENKARFIEGFMRGDPTMRDMEDLGEASQYEQAKAMTTSDPRMMVLTELRQSLEKAELRKQAFDRAQAGLRRKLAQANENKRDYTKRIAEIEADIAQRVDVKGDAFEAQADGITFTERAKFGEALLVRMDRMAAEKKITGKTTVIGKMGGFDLAAQAFAFAGKVDVELYLVRNGTLDTIPESNSALGLVQSIASRLGRFEDNLAFAKNELARAEQQLVEFAGRGNDTFAGQAEIDDLYRQVTDLESELAAESNKDAAKESRPDDLFAEPAQPERTMTDRQRAELEARQKQGMSRRGAQQGLGDQEGGLFGAERAQGSLFSRAGGSGGPVDADALQARLKALGLSDKVTLQIVDTLDGAAGDYRGGGAAVMRVAMDTRQDGMFTLDHEAIHALRGAGLFTASEWSLLTAAARRDEKTMASIRRRYADLDPEAQLEEAVADRFAAWARGERQAGALARLFQRIADVLSAIRNALTGTGFDSAGAVMRRIDRGDVGSREGIASQGDVQQSRVTQELDLTEYVADSPTGRLGQMLDRVRVKLQDRYLPLLRVQQRVESAIGRPLPQVANPYVREELMTGRIGAKLDRLSKDMIDPLFVAMHNAGVSVDELETYLYARHAPERNAQIAKINPELPDGGSGMSDIEATALINRMDQAGKLDAIKAIADMVDGIRDYALRLRTESGLLSADEAKAWRDTYENYVPLRGREEVEGDATGLTERVRRAGGINVRGKESRRAFGRRSKADNILAYTLLQAEEAIVRSETNRVAQAFVNMVRLAPDPEFWQVEKVTRKAVLDSTTGMVRYENQTRVQAEDKDWTVAAKFGGEEVRVTMERTNPSARRLATAMKRLTEHQLDWVVQYLGIPTRFLSAVNTSWNPEFIITNAFRDLQSALVNLTGEQRAGLVGGVARDYRKALVASTKGAFGKGEGEWARWYKEMTDEGGRVFFNRIDDLDALKKRVQEGMTRAEGKLTLKRGLIAVRDFVEAANNGVENAVRLATYKNARELGLSKQEAASLAKNVTVNFNRRGELGAGLNAFYMFFNASVQGSVRILTAMRSKRVRKILAGVAVGSFMLELLNALLSDDDDDGESYYDKISAFDKNRNIVIMLPGEGGRHIKIPMPYGYNVFASLGRTSAEIIRRGGDGAMTSASDFVTAVVDAFNPVGGTESLLNFISPTLVDPIVDLMRNRDYADRPIMPEANAYGPQEPDAQRYFGSVGPQWRAITDALTALTGGDDVVAGAIDVSPETLEYLSGTVFGAAGAFLDRQISLGAKILDGDPATAVEASDLPMARKVFASKPSWYDRSAYYDRMAQVEQAVSNASDYLERQDVQRFESYVDANRQLLTLEPAMKEARRTMRQLRAARGEAELANRLGRLDDAGYQRIRNQVRDQEEVIIRQFNTLWNATMHPRDDAQP